MGDEFTLEDALIILRRRALFFLIPAIALAVLGVAVVMLLPARYTSQGTISVDSAQISSDLVKSTINAFAQERIQVIRQRVMTRENMLAVADKYEVFPKDRFSATERVRKMRDRLKIVPITAEGARTTAQRDGTIAFTVAYTDGSPDRAFKVANEIMSSFLTEDVRTRTAGASNTTDFFKQEVQRLSRSVDAIEQKIADFKAQNASALPEYRDMHMAMLERTSRDLSTAEASISSLEEELRFLETQLASHFAGASGEGGPAQELARLKSELAQLRSVYRDAHPNVQAVKDQIRAVQGQLAPSRQIQELQASLRAAQTDLKTAKQTLPEGDPQIAEKQKALDAMQAQLSERVAKEAAAEGGDFLSSQLQGRMAVAESRRESLLSQVEDAKARAADLEARIARTPEVERGLQALTRDHENTFKEYQDILAKQQEAQLAENLEDNQKAEKFSILEAAERPETPSSPERVKLGVLAIFAAMGAGFAAAAGAEMAAATVRGRTHLTRIAGAHPIAVIPHFRREAGKKGRSAPPQAAQAAAAAAVASAVAGAAMHAGPPDVSRTDGDAAPTRQMDA